MISKDLLLTVLNYLANGSIAGSLSNTKFVPYQVIIVMKNNKVTVSRTTVTSISVRDVKYTSDEETLIIRYSATDASPMTYVTDEIEVWASTQGALLYKIADVALQTPLKKSEHDYLNVEYEVIITAGANYMQLSALSRYASIITFPTLIAPILYFFGLFMVPNWVNVLKQNPTFPQSQLVNYISEANFPSINVMYVGSEQAMIVSKLVGFGKGNANLTVNGQVSSPVSNAPVFIGFTTSSGIIVIAFNYFSGTIDQYVSIEIPTVYGSPTVVKQYETETTGERT